MNESRVKMGLFGTHASMTGSGTGRKWPSLATLETFSYDDVGNPAKRGTFGYTPDADYDDYSYNSNNQLTEYDSIVLEYDKNGNLTKKTEGGTEVTTYTFDYENRLIRIDYPDETYSAYKYDPLGRRIEKRDRSGDIRRYVYDDHNFIAEYDGSNNLLATYIQSLGIDQPISMFSNDEMYWYHGDALGSIYQMTNSSQDVVQTYDYSAFGKIISESGSLPFENPITYTGREFDSDSGLYYYRARYYSAETGRFLSRDPLSVTLPLLLEHTYSYVKNSPLNEVDPMGLWTKCRYLGAGISGCCTCDNAFVCLAPIDATIVAVTSGRPYFRIVGCKCDCVYSAPYFGGFTRPGSCRLARAV